jgi:hypothetical protein
MLSVADNQSDREVSSGISLNYVAASLLSLAGIAAAPLGSNLAPIARVVFAGLGVVTLGGISRKVPTRILIGPDRVSVHWLPFIGPTLDFGREEVRLVVKGPPPQTSLVEQYLGREERVWMALPRQGRSPRLLPLRGGPFGAFRSQPEAIVGALSGR